MSSAECALHGHAALPGQTAFPLFSHGQGHPFHGHPYSKVRPGAIITDEPGLYIDEWEIGIRIEDDILITEDGCEVLSENLMRDPDQIEAFMQEKEA